MAAVMVGSPALTGDVIVMMMMKKEMKMMTVTGAGQVQGEQFVPLMVVPTSLSVMLSPVLASLLQIFSRDLAQLL